MGGDVTPLPGRVVARVLARSLLVQAAWNYTSLQGVGAAFAMLPALDYLHRDPDAFAEAVQRHAEPFNAHPYLSSLALGSFCRMEAEGEPGDRISRFRTAVGGPLGALGDRLVWAAWLPLCTVVAVCLYLAGLAPLWTVLAFLVVYNAGHLVLRVWGFREGWESGIGLAVRLRSADLANLSRRVERWLVGALGFLVGLAILAPTLRGELPVPWASAALLVMALGAILGPRVWRPTAAVTVAAVASILTFGFFV